MKCACCALEREPAGLASFERDLSVRVCRDCIRSLGRQVGMLDVIARLPVTDMGEAVRFYTAAGFDVTVYTAGAACVHYSDVIVFDLDVDRRLDIATNRAGCYVTVDDPDRWHKELFTVGLPVSTVADRPWGMREFTLVDPSRNRIRIGGAIP